MDTPSLLRFFLAFAMVMALMGGLAFILKYISQNRLSLNNSNRRLSVVEVLGLDAKRRAMILKCDDEEHLVILSQSGETVVQQNLKTPQNNVQGKKKTNA